MDIVPLLHYNGKKIFYELNESKLKEKAIIFVHGSGGSTYTWKDQISKLDVSYSVVAFDLPSHSKTEDFPSISLDLYVETLKALLDTLKFNEIILAGHSLGGAVIQDFYFKYPNKVSALILMGSGARLRVSQNIFKLTQHNFQGFLDQYPAAFDRKTSKEIYEPVVNRVALINPEVIYTDYKICDNFDIMDKVQEISVPCLIICGNQDILTPPKYAKYFHDKIKSSELVLINRAGHFVMLEKPEEVNQAIKEFINKYLFV